MAKKYQQQTYGGSYQGSAQSQGFNPVKVADESKQYTQRSAELNRDLKTQSDHLKRTNIVNTAQAKADQSSSNANFKAFTGLLSLGKQGIGWMQEQEKLKEQEELKALQEEQERQMMEATGLGGDSGVLSPEQNKQDLEGLKDIDAQVGAESNAIHSTANEADDGTAEGASVANQLEQIQIARQDIQTKGNVYIARGGHQAYIDEALRNVPDAQRPRTQAEATALIQAINRQFIRDYGLAGLDPKLVRTVLAPTLLQNTQQSTAALTKAGITATHQENLDVIKSQASELAAAPGTTGRELWNILSNGTANGNIGHRGFSAASNRQAVEIAIEIAKVEGRPDLLEELLDLPKIPGQPNGPKIGDEYGYLLRPAIDQAADVKRGEWTDRQADHKINHQKAAETYFANPSPESRQAYAEALRAIPTKAAQDELKRLTSEGLSVDSQYELELAQRAARGEYISPSELKEAKADGRIRDEVYNRHAKTNADLQNEKAAADHVRGMSATITSSIQATMPSDAKLSPSMRQQLVMRRDVLSAQLAERMAAEMRSNPELKDNPLEMQKLANSQLESLLKQEQYQLDVGGDGVRWKAPMRSESFDTNAKKTGIVVAPGEQSFTDLPSKQLLNNNIVPRTEISISDDYLIDLETLQREVKHEMDGGVPESGRDNRVEDLAQGLGISRKALLDGQLRRYGLPPMDTLEQPIPIGEDFNISTGYDFIQRDLGFPPRGSAYLASAIQHESSWIGTREWEEVKNDGTDRNGGLISWASWSDDPARLGKIESHFGKPISAITETEQLRYMKQEMQTPYFREAYNIFMDANASSADLQWAVSRYWGFDPKYTGDRWTDAEDIIRRGRP